MLRLDAFEFDQILVAFCSPGDKITQMSSKLPLFFLSYLFLIDGPLSVNVSGPMSTWMGFLVTLTCSADSRPDGVFRWFFNNHSSFLEEGSVLTMPEELANDGNYICEVWNPVTNITMYTMKSVTFGGFTVLFRHCLN